MKLSIASAALLISSITSNVSAFSPSSVRHKGTALNVAAIQPETEASPVPVSGGWAPNSWTDKVAKQMPVYDDKAELDRAVEELSNQAPLVFAGEVRSLHEQLAKASQGQGFLLMGGDCAESFKEFMLITFLILSVYYCKWLLFLPLDLPCLSSKLEEWLANLQSPVLILMKKEMVLLFPVTVGISSMMKTSHPKLAEITQTIW